MKLFFLVLSFLALQGQALSASDAASFKALSAQVDKHFSLDDEHLRIRKDEAAFFAAFGSDVGERAPSAFTDQKLEWVLRGSQLANTYASTKSLSRIMSAVSAELFARGKLAEAERKKILNQLLQGRQFDLIKQHVKLFSGLERPTLIGEPLGAHLVLERDPRAWRTKRLEVAESIVIVGNPQCRFTLALIDSIQTDREIDIALKGAVWLTPPMSIAMHESVGRWNQKHPKLFMHEAFSLESWRALPAWGTPTIYFLRGNQVISTVHGWPKSGNKAQLLRAASEAGRKIKAQ